MGQKQINKKILNNFYSLYINLFASAVFEGKPDTHTLCQTMQKFTKDDCLDEFSSVVRQLIRKENLSKTVYQAIINLPPEQLLALSKSDSILRHKIDVKKFIRQIGKSKPQALTTCAQIMTALAQEDYVIPEEQYAKIIEAGRNTLRMIKSISRVSEYCSNDVQKNSLMISTILDNHEVIDHAQMLTEHFAMLSPFVPPSEDVIRQFLVRLGLTEKNKSSNAHGGNRPLSLPRICIY